MYLSEKSIKRRSFLSGVSGFQEIPGRDKGRCRRGNVGESEEVAEDAIVDSAAVSAQMALMMLVIDALLAKRSVNCVVPMQRRRGNCRQDDRQQKCR